MPANGHEEHNSTVDDHGEDRRKNAQDLEREQCASMRRVTEATGASAHELQQLMQRLLDIDRSGSSAGIVAQGHIAADRMRRACRHSTSATATWPNSAAMPRRASTSGCSSR